VEVSLLLIKYIRVEKQLRRGLQRQATTEMKKKISQQKKFGVCQVIFLADFYCFYLSF
jgi:hypothetical protein